MSDVLVLVVEDEPRLREVYSAALRSEGYRVDVCEDGLEALEYLKCHHPELVLLDLNLPKVSGLAIHAQLRHDPRTRLLPIVVITGDPNPPRVLDNTVILRKPCALRELMYVVKKALADGP